MKKECFDLHLPLVQRTVRTIGRRWAMHKPKTKKSVELDPICYCFADKTIDRTTSRVKPGHTSALLIHDFGCQLVPELLAKGITDITIGIHTDHLNDSDNLFKYTVLYIKNTFRQFNLKFMKVSDTIGMHFDLVIANTPYGSVGANITKSIIKHVTFNQFINLLPANDYMRNTEKDLYKYATNMEPISNGFVGMGANVTTHIAEISQTSNDELSVEEFEIMQYVDPQLTKYFRVLRTRSHYAIDAANLSGSTDSQFKQFDINTTVTVSSRDVNHHHLPYSRTCETYRYNVTRDITNEEIFESRKALRKGVYDGWLSITGILNNTAVEKTNQVNFMYSSNGFRFLAKVFTAVNVDGTLNFGKVFPKVDWTRAWTVEEILEDYGYTTEEIAAVIADLENFKDMKRDANG